jgi:hypothetical protein
MKPKYKRKVNYLKDNPMIRLSGKYLIKYGFSIGSDYYAEFKKGLIILSNTNRKEVI